MDDDEAECENCGNWFVYVMLNPNYPRIICNDCISEWRAKYARQYV